MVYHVRTPHLLVQAGGYLKHIYGKKHLSAVYFRGQPSLYELNLIPTLYRGARSSGTCSKRNGVVKHYLDACRQQGQVLKQVPEYAWEPLLQHYGIRTRWLDVVDNVWVALWFACHEAHVTGHRGEFLHFERRVIKEDGQENFAYILLLEVGDQPAQESPGLTSGSMTQAIDLRVACPSTFLRPHAQHGLLIRKKPSQSRSQQDYSDTIVGIARVSLRDAFEWLGDGVLLTTHVLFPPPVYDFGYRDLLNYAPEPKTLLGAVSHIGA